MRDIKDTLGIKYDKYTSIYKLDNEKVGLLLKYLMWTNGKEIILNDVSELTKKRIEKKSKEIEEQIETMLEYEVFEIVFNEMTQPIKISHKCWQQLKDNIENKKRDYKTSTETPTEAKAESIKEEQTEDNYYTYKNGILDINTDLINQKIKSLNTKYTETEISEYVSLSVHHQKKDLFNQYGYMTFSIEEIIEQMKEDGFPCSSDVFKEEEGPF